MENRESQGVSLLRSDQTIAKHHRRRQNRPYTTRPHDVSLSVPNGQGRGDTVFTASEVADGGGRRLNDFLFSTSPARETTLFYTGINCRLAAFLLRRLPQTSSSSVTEFQEANQAIANLGVARGGELGVVVTLESMRVGMLEERGKWCAWQWRG